MKVTILRFISAATLALLASQSAVAGDVVVIANAGTNLSAGEVRDVFLGEKQFAGSIKLVPVDNAAQQESFLAKMMQMSSAKYSGNWTKKAFRDGLAAPAMKSGDAEVIEFVKRTKGAVGYVSSSPSGVNIIK
ncbi:MAG: phosphate ABC transporter substrate-binding protein [Gallionella sp.]|nr:phosphate ABC transporter substrate-binding protein [Gallionella sp.]